MKEAEEIIFLRILSIIYKCKNDMEMIGKYIKLYEVSFKDSNSPQYFYTCLKYIHFQNKPIQNHSLVTKLIVIQKLISGSH